MQTDTMIVLSWFPNRTDDIEALLPLTGVSDGIVIDELMCGIGDAVGLVDGNIEIIGRAVCMGEWVEGVSVGLEDVGTCDGVAVVGAAVGITVGMHMLQRLPSGQYSQLLQ